MFEGGDGDKACDRPASGATLPRCHAPLESCRSRPANRCLIAVHLLLKRPPYDFYLLHTPLDRHSLLARRDPLSEPHLTNGQGRSVRIYKQNTLLQQLITGFTARRLRLRCHHCILFYDMTFIFFIQT